MEKWSIIVSIAIVIVPIISASNIVIFHLLATSSHRTTIWPLVERLADKGNKITYIFPAENRDGFYPNIEEIAPSKAIPIVKEFVADFDVNIKLNNTIHTWTLGVFGKCVELCGAFYDSPEVRQWLSRPNLKYDLFLIDASFGECAYGLVHKFQAKHILFAPVISEHFWDGFGLVSESASVPEMLFSQKPEHMGFASRFVTTLASFMFRLSFCYFEQQVEVIMRNHFNDPTIPDVAEFTQNTSLVLLNSNFIEDYPRALPPFMVPFSGLWCGREKRDKRKLLPQDIASFLEDGQEFIYVSFGSAVIISRLPEERLEQFLNAFAAFPRIKFLWRWTGTIPPNNLPKNVFVKNWFPQRDLLANPNIKGFITQAGRPSTQEAICYGVPMISFPFFADQDNNANRLEQIGAGITFDITGFTSVSLQAGIKELISNSSYQLKMKDLSAMFRDRPLDPVDNALFWTEYVLRHDTSLMRPLGMKYAWWQRRLLDVYAVILLCIIALMSFVTVSLYLLVTWVLQICSKKVKAE